MDQPQQASPPAAGALAALGLLLLAARLPHFGPRIDEPHAWRQMDTAQYIRAFAEDPLGIDLLHPAVSWMGNHKTLILEFPLPEAVAAWLLRSLGASPGNLLIPRLVFFAFFLAAVLGFFLLVRDLMGPKIAAWAGLFYLASPLSQAYSRAVHIDFTVLAFVHFALLFLLRGIRRESMALVLLGGLAATVAALIKGPYLLSGLFILAPFALQLERRPFLVRTAVVLTLPLLAFGLWRQYAEATNALAPDWGFIPEYHRFTDMGGWYFGSWTQRLRFSAWRSILAVTGRDVLGVATLPFIIAGALSLVRGWRGREGHWKLGAWIVGSAVYILVFFNLNVVHDYYQLPLIAPLSILAAMGIDALMVRTRRSGVAWTVGALVFASNVAGAEARFYKPVGATVQAGELVRDHTPMDALVIASWPEADPRAPHLLFAAHRYGWSVRSRFLTPAIVEKLHELGATHLALLLPSAEPSGRALPPEHTRSFSFANAAGETYRLDLVELKHQVKP